MTQRESPHGRITSEVPPERAGLRQYFDVFRYSRRAVELVWTTSRSLTVGFAVLSLVSGVLPGGIAWVGKHLIDTLVAAATSGSTTGRGAAMQWVVIEMGLIVVLAAAQRGISILQSLLRAQLGNRVNVMILE